MGYFHKLRNEEHKDAHEFYWKKLNGAMPFDSPHTVIEFMHEFAKQEINKTLQQIADSHHIVEPYDILKKEHVEYHRGFHNGKIAFRELIINAKK